MNSLLEDVVRADSASVHSLFARPCSGSFALGRVEEREMKERHDFDMCIRAIGNGREIVVFEKFTDPLAGSLQKQQQSGKDI
jgi:hypothetical protein